MKLRNQLFLSLSALLTVALVGMLLAIFSVLHLTKQQSEAMYRNLTIVEATLSMGHELSKQTTLLLTEVLDEEALKQSDQRFQNLLAKAAESAIDENDRQAVSEVRRAYDRYQPHLDSPAIMRTQLFTHDQFTRALAAVRDRLNNVQMRYVNAVESTEQQTRESAWMVTWLLGAIGLAIVLIGLVTAHSIARRFAEPIETLADAAGEIGKGNFNVTLPLPSIHELNALIHRFGLMAEALREFKNSDIEALQAEQQRLQAVLDSIDDGLLIFDPQGRLEHYNPVAQRQLDCKPSHLGEGPSRLLHQDTLDQQLQLILQGATMDTEADDLSITIDGESRILAFSLTPISQGDDPVRGAVMVLRDVTEQRTFERVRSEFVLRASHELRTPVTGMHMAFALLQERVNYPEDTREADLIRTVEEEMQRLLLLINDLLNFSRYQNGLQQLELAPESIDELMDQARQRSANITAAKDITLTCEVEPGLPRIPADRLQIERVLDNLIGNAVRHTRNGGSIRLQAVRQNEQVLLAVVDNGEGIPYGQQARVFEPFVQIGKRKGGAGLGLALCKEIIQLHGGRIGVQSQPGHGTRFYFSLPQ
ncbi:ATP-binding protein [Halopseudomonas salegens]|uniref:histidine kinase n=1 Tax=Halopseudomonas salegens TaxID=1434072 RepID=A0A1H2ETE3_9GAMM|nr:ATP-binding protein [Halopseudomonas salegens]SDT98355.1 Alginate biosynthesis sensor protein KinB [Halopseudomonas salegens]